MAALSGYAAALIRLRPLDQISRLVAPILATPPLVHQSLSAPSLPRPLLPPHHPSPIAASILGLQRTPDSRAQQLRQLPSLPLTEGQQSSLASFHALQAVLDAIDEPPTAAAEPLLCLKRTYQPSITKRKRTHGFMIRMVTKGGRRVIRNRIKKGRWRTAV